jgi:hypothetical protein
MGGIALTAAMASVRRRNEAKKRRAVAVARAMEAEETVRLRRRPPEVSTMDG